MGCDHHSDNSYHIGGVLGQLLVVVLVAPTWNRSLGDFSCSSLLHDVRHGTRTQVSSAHAREATARMSGYNIGADF